MASREIFEARRSRAVGWLQDHASDVASALQRAHDATPCCAQASHRICLRDFVVVFVVSCVRTIAWDVGNKQQVAARLMRTATLSLTPPSRHAERYPKPLRWHAPATPHRPALPKAHWFSCHIQHGMCCLQGHLYVTLIPLRVTSQR